MTAAGRAIAGVALTALLLQFAAATWIIRDYTSPNAATQLAVHLAATGRLALPADDGSERARAYLLPGEPIYLAAGFRAMPSSLWPYLHVPVAALYVTAVAMVALALGGPRLGLTAGLVANVDPFVLAHGAVWDDTWLAAALEWSIFAALSWQAVAGRSAAPAARVGSWAIVAVAAGWAAVTRAESAVVIVATAAAAICLRSQRKLRALGIAMLTGTVLVLAAWGARNASVLGSFYVGSTHDGITLVDANCIDSRRLLRERGQVAEERDCFGREERTVEMSELGNDRRLKRDAMAYAAAHPLDVAKTAALKIGVSLTGFDFRQPARSTRNIVGVGTSLLFVVAGVVGLTTRASRTRATSSARLFMLLLGVTGGVTLGMLVIGPAGLRYRVGLSGFLYIGVAQLLLTPAGRLPSAAKRGLDVALSGTGLLLSLPVWAVLAAAIKLEDGGEVFYGQERVGQGGRIFRVLKFRSMVPDAESKVGAIQAAFRDPRITRIGHWMRATAADELPQLWNIFRGDMSFVGPRALRPGEIEVGGDGTHVRLEDVPGFEQRCRVRPGLTGVAQIYAPRDIPRRWKFQYDKIYIRQPSFWLDLRLILLSFWITLRGTWEVRGRKF